MSRRLARIPSINSWPLLNKIGFCQRISFFFNYVPIAWLSILRIYAKTEALQENYGTIFQKNKKTANGRNVR